MKTVLVVNKMGDVGRELRKRGYDVKEASGYSGHADAILYEKENIPKNAQGLLINTSGKSVDEIEKIISSKLYSPLF